MKKLLPDWHYVDEMPFDINKSSWIFHFDLLLESVKINPFRKYFWVVSQESEFYEMKGDKNYNVQVVKFTLSGKVKARFMVWEKAFDLAYEGKG
mgnify:CR=1 FL=1